LFRIFQSSNFEFPRNASHVIDSPTESADCGRVLDSSYRIRQALAADLEALPAIEIEAGKLFAEIGLGSETEGDATSPEDFAHCHAQGLLWVAVDAADAPVGFAFVEIIGGLVHLEELDVHPDHGRRGVGAALVEAVIEFARARGFRAVTLTTFRDVPWNMPFYSRLGFRPLSDAELSPELRQVVDDETSRGLPPEQRVVMRYDVGHSA
jgi:GNAT superfamily N-acetyltransferase